MKFIGSRKDLTEDKLDELEGMVMDSMKAQSIYEAAKMSMGTSFTVFKGREEIGGGGELFNISSLQWLKVLSWLLRRYDTTNRICLLTQQ